MSKPVTVEMVKQAGLLLKREHEEKLRLQKVASGLELEKRAMKIAFREVELGICEPFRTFEDLQEKVAGLIREDLDVVEKALERGYGSGMSRGDLDDQSNGPVTADGVFKRWVLTGEMD